MIDLIKKFFGEASQPSDHETPVGEHDIRVATCALFVEMANIDSEFGEREKEHIVSMLTSEHGLSREYADELTRVASEELDGSIDLWRFTNLINQNYSKKEKTKIVEMIWHLVYADGHLSDHENYLIHKLGKMLRFTHRELIDAKLAVLHKKGESPEN